jgi:hypothetical protein
VLKGGGAGNKRLMDSETLFGLMEIVDRQTVEVFVQHCEGSKATEL